MTQLALGQGTIIRGGITKAIDHLGQHRSPDILIVDISGVDLPISKVNELADVCEPGVAVIASATATRSAFTVICCMPASPTMSSSRSSPQLLAKALTSRPGPRRRSESDPQKARHSRRLCRGARRRRHDDIGGQHGLASRQSADAGGSPLSTSTCRTAIARWRSKSSRPPGCARRSPIRCGSTTRCSSA